MSDQTSTQNAFKQLRVLIVDDNAAVRGLVRAVLSAFGCDAIFEASSAKQCLEILEIEQIDIIVLDWKMKPVDGLTLVTRLRDQESSPNAFVPIIMLTAYAEPSKIKQARDAGVTEFMVKPFSSDALYKRIMAIVNRPRNFVRTKQFFGPDRRRLSKGEYEGEERREEAG